MLIRYLVGPALLGLTLAAPAASQTPQAPAEKTSPEQSFIGSTRDAGMLSELPLSENVYSLLETSQPEVISDRFNSGGLNAGEAPRIGAFLASWSQTLFRIGDVDVSDPTGGGASLLFPEIAFWRQVDVATGMMPLAADAPGLAVTLSPLLPAARWTSTGQAFGAGGDLASLKPNGPVLPVVRLNSWAHGSALVSGPISDRFGIVAGGTLTRASKFLRESIDTGDSNLGSGFVHLVFTPSPENQSRTIGWVQRARVPFDFWRALSQPTAATRDVSAHVQSTWERQPSTGIGWRLFGGFTARSRATERQPASSLTIERLNDGPISAIVAAIGDSTAQRWTAGARALTQLRSGASHHAMEVGVDVEGTAVRMSNEFTGPVGELVNALPARVWAFTNPGTGSKRHATTVSAFFNDHLTLSPTLNLDAGMRFESVTGNADGAKNGVSWLLLLPRAALRWESGGARTALILGYRRAANRLNLDLLAFGDPAESTATIARWIPSPSLAARPAVDALAAIVARVGPGTGGDPAFSSIDPDLRRPYTDEVVVGFEGRPFSLLRIGMMGTARREGNLIEVVNTGVSASDYSTVSILDTGVDIAHPADQIVTAYNRLPSGFGKDRYVLTNPDQRAATLYAFTLAIEVKTGPLYSLLGATAAAISGPAASRGFGPLENDQDVPGELFADPNAATFQYGRLFDDRGFTGKWTTVCRLPADVRVGAIVRYQDGQAFSRLVIAPDLNQGPEAVRAYESGGTRFTFTGSLDLRIQKGLAIGSARLDAILDFYNLVTRSNEVEEYVITGPAFRTPTAIEPPRAIHLGLRLTF